MTQWLNRGTRRARLFLRHACLAGVLLAVLAGCNEGDGGQEPAQATFVADTKPVDESKVPAEKVVGTVTIVPGTNTSPPHVDHFPAADECDTSKPWFGFEPWSQQYLDLLKRCSEERSEAGVNGPRKEPKPFKDPFGSTPGANKAAAHDAIDMDHGHDDLPMPTGRFLETAPDTIEGATFESSPTYQYDLGELVAQSSWYSDTFGIPATLMTPIKGWVRYPAKAVGASVAPDTYPVIIFLHGQHTDSATEHSYQGYDYLAKDLAEHGYVALSIDASTINNGSRGGDESSLSRAQLVLGTLDRMRQINGFGQVDLGGNAGKLDPLKGKLDFSRIGIMGHSRGGQGVSNAILFNRTRRGTTMWDLIALVENNPSSFTANPDLVDAIKNPNDETPIRAAMAKYNMFLAAGSGNANVPPPYDFKGAFMLAPTDFGNSKGLDNVPLANLLPSCDGDVSDLQGAAVFDRNRFGPDGDVAPRYQIMVHGANHNYYNTVWTEDDFDWRDGNYFCRSNADDSIRLKEEDQRRSGRFLIESFMRYHVGGEKLFASYWNGAAHMPAASCPSGQGACDARVILTVQQGDDARKIILSYNWGDSLTRNALGGDIAFSGYDAFNLNCCNGVQSVVPSAELAWSKPNASIVTDLKGLSGKGFDALTFRIAVVRPMGQEVYVTLTDSAGKVATVTASNFSDALYNAPRKKAGGDVEPEDVLPLKDDPADTIYAEDVKKLLNMVAIPLRAFEGIDTTSLKELKLTFPKASGKVALADIELQDFGRDKRACEVAMPQPDWCRTAPQVAKNNAPQQTAQPEKDKDKLLLISQ